MSQSKASAIYSTIDLGAEREASSQHREGKLEPWWDWAGVGWTRWDCAKWGWARWDWAGLAPDGACALDIPPTPP